MHYRLDERCGKHDRRMHLLWDQGAEQHEGGGGGGGRSGHRRLAQIEAGQYLRRSAMSAVRDPRLLPLIKAVPSMTMMELAELSAGAEPELGGWLTIENASLSAGTKNCSVIPMVAEPALGDE